MITKYFAMNSFFKNRRITGALSESIAITFRDYDQFSIQYCLISQQRENFFVNILANEARTIFLSNVGHVMLFKEIENVMLKEYSSNSSQLQVQWLSQTMHIDTFMAENEIGNPSDALKKW